MIRRSARALDAEATAAETEQRTTPQMRSARKSDTVPPVWRRKTLFRIQSHKSTGGAHDRREGALHHRRGAATDEVPQRPFGRAAVRCPLKQAAQASRSSVPTLSAAATKPVKPIPRIGVRALTSAIRLATSDTVAPCGSGMKQRISPGSKTSQSTAR